MSGNGKPDSGRDSWYKEAAASCLSGEVSPASGRFTLNILVKRMVTFDGGFPSFPQFVFIKADELPVVYAGENEFREAGDSLAVLPGSSSAEMICIFVEEPR
jgi:hypothetical protein